MEGRLTANLASIRRHFLHILTALRSFHAGPGSHAMSAAAMKDLVARYPNSARGHVDVHAIEAAKESHKRIDIVRREHPADLQIAQAGSIDNNGFRGVAVE